MNWYKKMLYWLKAHPWFCKIANFTFWALVVLAGFLLGFYVNYYYLTLIIFGIVGYVIAIGWKPKPLSKKIKEFKEKRRAKTLIEIDKERDE